MEGREYYSSNTGNATEYEHMPTSLVCLICLEGLAIVVLNFAVILVLVIKKKKFPSVYRVQLLCLAGNDTLVGVGNFLLCLVDQPYIKNSYFGCASVLAFTFISQSASLYSIFGICIHRFLVLKRCNQNKFTWKHNYTIGCTIVAWTMGISVSSIPFVAFYKTNENPTLNYCSLPTMLKEDLRKGVLMLLGSYLVPLMFVNLIYTVLFYKIKKFVSRIEPVNAGIFSNNVSDHRVTEPLTSNVATITLLYAVRQDSLGPSNRPLVSISENHPNNGSTDSKSFHCNNSFKNNVTNSAFAAAVSNANNVPSVQPRNLDQSTRSIRERNIFTLLGIILILLNTLTWPGIGCLVMAVVLNSSKLDRNILIPILTIMSLNSAVNPLLYSMRIPEFRSSITEIKKSVSERITCPCKT